MRWIKNGIPEEIRLLCCLCCNMPVCSYKGNTVDSNLANRCSNDVNVLIIRSFNCSLLFKLLLNVLSHSSS